MQLTLIASCIQLLLLVPFLLLCFLQHMIVTVVAAISTPTMAAMTPIMMAEINKVSNKYIV